MSIDKALQQVRFKLSNNIIRVCGDTMKFSNDVLKALGEVSIEEAIESIKKFFNEEMDKLK